MNKVIGIFNYMKDRAFRVTMFVMALLIIGALAMPALAQNVPCYFSLGGAKFTAAVYRSVICEWEMQSTTVLDIQAGVTETHANDPVFSGNPVFSGGPVFSGLDLNGSTLTWDADADTTSVASFDDTITYTIGAASGSLDIATGNLQVGNGIPTFTQDGEDAYIEGTMEMASDWVLGAQSSFSVAFGLPITPTGAYQPLISFDHGAGDGQAVSPIAAPVDDTTGKQLIIHNINASQVITIDGTGTTVECKSDIVMDVQDTLTLLWNGDDWICISNYDNS